MTLLLDTALAMNAAGYAVLPVRPDGSKAPAVAWKQYVEQRPDEAQLRAWFTGDQFDGLGVITGRDGLVMLEAEGRAVADKLHEQLAQLMTDSGLGDLWTRLCTGWMELTPSGGLHWYVRVVDEHDHPAPVGGNTKLARRPGADGTPVEVLFETRGTGGFTVTSPSAGRTHPSDKPWLLLAGSHATPATLTVDEYDAVTLAMSSFDQIPTHSAGTISPAGRAAGANPADRPGDDYNTRLGPEGLLQLLIDHGWTRCHRVGPNVGVRRPGKDRGSISGTVMRRDDGTGGFYCWSTSTDFDTERPYDAIGTLAVLEHGGNIADTARALRKAGYGAPLDHAPDPSIDQVQEVTPEQLLGRPTVQVQETPTGGLRTSEDTLARMLVAQHGDVIRYCAERGRWLAWSGSRWEWQHDGAAVVELAKQIARGLPDGSAAEIAHKRRCLSANGLAGVLRLASTDVRIRVRMRELDADAYVLNTPAGIVDLRTGQLAPASPTYLVTRTTAVAPAAGPAPMWEQFLARTFAGDPDLTAYTQRVLGQALIGKVVYPHLEVAYGQTATGKTTTANVCMALLGNQSRDGYAHVVDPALLLRQRHSAHPTERAQLAGVRLVITSEVDKVAAFDEAKLKRFTGGDELDGRFMGKDFFSFSPSHFILMLVNDRPDVSADDDAIWRRIRLLPFVHQVPEHERDQGLADAMVATEGPQILAWLIAGAADFTRHGLTEPDSVKAATRAYRTDVDTVGRFVAECCELAPAGTQTYAVASAAVRSAYEKWCSDLGETPVSAKALTIALKARFQVEQSRTNRTRMLDGIRLIETDTENAGEAWWSK